LGSFNEVPLLAVDTFVVFAVNGMGAPKASFKISVILLAAAPIPFRK